MRILVACEFSGIVRDAFIAKGHDAVSCDLLPSERPGPHIQDDVLKYLNEGWDLMIAHPPCTYLSVMGAAWLNRRPARRLEMMKAAVFFRELLGAPIEKICIENPVIYREAVVMIGRGYDQVINPYQFGHPIKKRTCLWLKGLPPLKPTSVVQPTAYHVSSGHNWTCEKILPGKSKIRGQKDRSRTFPGIAEAMAEQWGTAQSCEISK